MPKGSGWIAHDPSADCCKRRIRAGDYFSTTKCHGRRRRRELLAPRLFRKPRGVSAAAGMVAHVDLLSHQCVGRSRRRPRTRVRDRPNPRQSHRERERKPPSESRSRLADANLHLRYAGVWRQLTVGAIGIYGRADTSLAGSVTGALATPLGTLPFSRFDTISDSVD